MSSKPLASKCASRCDASFDAWDGRQKCGRPKGHPGSHTRDPLPGERIVPEIVAALETRGVRMSAWDEDNDD